MRWCVAVFALVAVATPAAAQSTYVGASLVGDLARFNKVDVADAARILVNDSTADGEALGFNVKVGRAIGELWGLEFEYARSGEIETSTRQFAIPADVRGRLDILPPIPNFEIELESEQQHTTFAALAWVRQDLGQRIDLSFLGGVAFNRVEVEQDFRFFGPVIAIFPPPDLGDIETIEYNVGPTVGVEAAFKFGEAAAVTTGIRLQSASSSGRNGWLIRPNVGLRWTF